MVEIERGPSEVCFFEVFHKRSYMVNFKRNHEPIEKCCQNTTAFKVNLLFLYETTITVQKKHIANRKPGKAAMLGRWRKLD